MSKGTFKTDEACRYWWAQVSSAASMYERRWTRAALRRTDAMLADRLAAQQSLFDSACMHGTVADIEEQGGAMCRGWLVAVRTMNHADVADDAYVLGRCPKTGFAIAIGDQKPAAERVLELHGSDVVYITPDEVAMMMAGGFNKSVCDVKRVFPGAELLRYADEPAQGDDQ